MTWKFETLEEAQVRNVHAEHRNVGLVIETRPDLVHRDALAWYRKLGVTKVQMGAQSLDDHILQLNKRWPYCQANTGGCGAAAVWGVQSCAALDAQFTRCFP